MDAASFERGQEGFKRVGHGRGRCRLHIHRAENNHQSEAAGVDDCRVHAVISDRHGTDMGKWCACADEEDVQRTREHK